MNGTEDRLRDALHHAARTVEAPPLFPVPARRRVLSRPLAASLGVAAALGGVVFFFGAPVSNGPALTSPAPQEVSVYLCIRSSSNPACHGDTTEPQRRAIAERLRSLPEVQAVAYESREEAYGRFQRLFEDEPGFLASTRPGDVPDRFRVQARPGSVASIRADLSGLPGVDQVVEPPEGP